MPTRYLKPGICDSDTIDKCSPLAECLYYRLLVNVDDFGCLDARPAVIKAKCFPLKDDITNDVVEDLLRILAGVKLIHLYTSVDGKRFLQFCKWSNAARSKIRKYPPFNETCTQVYADVNDPRTVLPGTGTGTGTGTVPVGLPATQVKSSPEKKPPANDVVPYAKIVDLYHTTLPTLPKVKTLTTKRKAQIGARWRSGNLPDLDTWKKYFEYVAQSPFLMGQKEPSSPGKPRFISDLEWITTESNFAKIWEGKYHGK